MRRGLDRLVSIRGITYIFGFHPEEVPAYEFIGPRKKREIDGMTISTIESNDGGRAGFIVEVNGLTFFHAGDHANRYRDRSGLFRAEIDFLSYPFPLSFNFNRFYSPIL